MLIKLEKELKGAGKGSIVKVDEKTAKELIEKKEAVEYTAEVKREEIKNLAKEIKSLEKEVKGTKMPEILIKKDEHKEVNPFETIQKMFKGESTVKELTIKSGPTGINETTAADGGNLVYSEMASKIYGFANEGSVIFNKCEKIPVGDRANGVLIPYLDNSGVISHESTPRAYWVDEGKDKTVSKITWGQHNKPLKKLCFLIPLTDEIIEDVAGLQSYVLGYCRNRLGWMLDYAILNNAGGMAGVFASTNFRVQPVAHATYTAPIVRSLISGVMPSLRGGAEWFMSNDSWSTILGLLGDGVANQYNLIAHANPATLGGYAVNVMEQMPAHGSGSVLFGNFGQGYVCATKGDIKVDISKDYAFQRDETYLRLVVRAAGAPVVRNQTLIDTTVVSAFSTTS